MRRTLVRSGRRPAAGLVLAAALSILAGCAGARGSAGPSGSTARVAPATVAGTTTPADAPTSDPTPAPLAWSICGTGLQCATLVVPLDYAHPTGPTVSLAVMRRPATGPGDRIGDLVVNPGGPGASGLELVRDAFGRTNQFGQRFDIVSWDPRGVGQSQPLACGAGSSAFQHLDPDPPDPAGLAALDQSAAGLAADCAQHAGPLLDHVDTATTARDLEQLRRALGDPQLTFAGFSYGTAIGLAYAQRYPTRLRALLLDGVVEPDWDLEQFLSVQTSALDQALEHIFAACDADAHCPMRDGGAIYDQVAAKLRAHPLLVNGTTVGPSELATAAIETTYDPGATAQTFLRAVADADAGQGDALALLAARYRQAVPNFAGYVAVLCADLPHPVGAAAYQTLAASLEARSPRLGGAVANELLPCAFWSAPVARIPTIVRAPGSPPVLVVGNLGDAATPMSSATWVSRHLANAVLLTYDGQGHTSVGRSSCVDSIERRYLTDVATPPTGALCSAGT
jgi:pimeloyl-ACP methyl ester carboxylesterase